MRALFFWYFLAAFSAPAVLLDEIAVTVGNQAVTESQITQEIRLSALLNGEKPDKSPDARRLAAGRLVEQALIRQEITFGSYPSIPVAQVQSDFESTEKARGGAAALSALLSDYGLTRQDLMAYLRWQLELLQFINLRFRPAVQVSEEDIDKYYQENVVARAATAGKAPALKSLHQQIEQKLTGERVDQQLNEWMTRAKSRTIVRYLDSSLGSTPPAPVEQNTVQPH